MLEEKEPSRWGRWLALTILLLIALYVITDGWLTNVIEPHTALAVYEPGGVRALVNRTDKPRRMWKWPRIPGTLIGVKEEQVKDEPKFVSTRFAMYTRDELTGKLEDREYVQAYVVDVEIEVKDWQKFFKEIDLDKINRERRKAGPFTPLVKDRFEVIAYQIQSLIRNGPTQDAFGKPLRTKDGYPVMNLSDWTSYIYSQLLSRRNFLIALLDHFDFKTPNKIKKYLREDVPWYWFAGPDTFEALAQKYKDIHESISTPYADNISPEASRQRFTFGEEHLELYGQAYRAYQYEKFLIGTKEALKEIGTRLLYAREEKTRGLLRWQKEKLELEKMRWEKVKEKELIPFFKHFASSDTKLALDIRKVTPEENEILWDAAINEVLKGEHISKLSPFIIHEVKKGDTLRKLAQKYTLNWELVFTDYTQQVVRESLSEEKKEKFDKLLDESVRTGNLRLAYDFVKNVPLKVGESIIIDKIEKSTPDWFKEKEKYRKKREEVVKKYIYQWIEKLAPRVVEKYIPASPWIDYLEGLYGVKIGKIELHIEKDSMFTKAGEPKDEYYDLYYSKYISKEW